MAKSPSRPPYIKPPELKHSRRTRAAKQEDQEDVGVTVTDAGEEAVDALKGRIRKRNLSQRGQPLRESKSSLPNQEAKIARYSVGQAVRHRIFGFTGVIYDVDPEFANSEEWYESIPKQLRPRKNQPFYHLYAVTRDEEEPYVAYVSEQNLEAFEAGPDEIPNPNIAVHFKRENGRFIKYDRLN